MNLYFNFGSNRINGFNESWYMNDQKEYISMVLLSGFAGTHWTKSGETIHPYYTIL